MALRGFAAVCRAFVTGMMFRVADVGLPFTSQISFPACLWIASIGGCMKPAPNVTLLGSLDRSRTAARIASIAATISVLSIVSACNIFLNATA